MSKFKELGGKQGWADRVLVRAPGYLALCTTQKHFERVLKHLAVSRDEWPPFTTKTADASTHFFDNPKSGATVAVVCLGAHEGYSPIDVAALLVHEAVHVWQEAARSLGEKTPSREFEAYSIQEISHQLMRLYVEALDAPQNTP